MSELFGVSASELPQPQQPQKVPWQTSAGRAFDFAIYTTSTPWIASPAIYIFARVVEDTWSPLYIGEASNLQSRLADHPAWDIALRVGMSSVHVFFHGGNDDERRADAAALIRDYAPPLNFQHDIGPADADASVMARSCLG